MTVHPSRVATGEWASARAWSSPRSPSGRPGQGIEGGAGRAMPEVLWSLGIRSRAPTEALDGCMGEATADLAHGDGLQIVGGAQVHPGVVGGAPIEAEL